MHDNNTATQTHARSCTWKAQKLSSSPATVAGGATTGAGDGPVQSENAVIRNHWGSHIVSVEEKGNSVQWTWMTKPACSKLRELRPENSSFATRYCCKTCAFLAKKHWVSSGLFYIIYSNVRVACLPSWPLTPAVDPFGSRGCLLRAGGGGERVSGNKELQDKKTTGWPVDWTLTLFVDLRLCR